MMRNIWLGLSLLLVLIVPVYGQDAGAVCGVVDAIDLPVDHLDPDFDDFGLYRERWGGLHTGIDLAFNRYGETVRAAMRGRVTYSDPLGWGTERGVVVVEHIFPDNSIAYSVYGHMEETETVTFPGVGRCVERGQIIGTIGDPERSRPHLHYEIRTILPEDGGPGYVNTNPLGEGWYHPLDFTYLWRARLSPAFVEYVTFKSAPIVPPLPLDDNRYVVARNRFLEVVRTPDQSLWSVEAGADIVGVAALPDEALIAQTTSGQVLVLQNGRYVALWTIENAAGSFVALGSTLIFPTYDGLVAYDTNANLLWSLQLDVSRVEYIGQSGDVLLLVARGRDGTYGYVVNAAGDLLFDTRFNSIPIITAQSNGVWLAMDGGQIDRITATGRTLLNETLAQRGIRPGRTAGLTFDVLGNLYLWDGDGALMALDADGGIRWQVDYVSSASLQVSPLLRTDYGCLLYVLDAAGELLVYATADGERITSIPLYTGGLRSRSLTGRMLTVDAVGYVTVGGGFLTLFTLDGQILGGDTLSECRLG